MEAATTRPILPQYATLYRPGRLGRPACWLIVLNVWQQSGAIAHYSLLLYRRYTVNNEEVQAPEVLEVEPETLAKWLADGEVVERKLNG